MTETKLDAIRMELARQVCCGTQCRSPQTCAAVSIGGKDADESLRIIVPYLDCIRRAALEEAAQSMDELAEGCRVNAESILRDWMGDDIPADDRMANKTERHDFLRRAPIYEGCAKRIRALADQPSGLQPVPVDRLDALLENPPEPSPALRKLLTTPAPWETHTAVAPSDAEVERAAKAIFIANHNGNPIGDESGWVLWIPDAKAAITALRAMDRALASSGNLRDRVTAAWYSRITPQATVAGKIEELFAWVAEECGHQYAEQYEAIRAMDRERGLVTVPRHGWTEAMINAGILALNDDDRTSAEKVLDIFEAVIEAHEREGGQ